MKDNAWKNKSFILRLDGISVKITILFALSLAGSLIFLNRWVVTDLGFHSFGRVWQYYVSYFDYGFVRRAFFGTVLDVTGLNKAISNPYFFSYALYSIKIIILSLIVFIYVIKNKVFTNVYGYIVVFFSPAFILQAGYLTGNQDLELTIILAIVFLYVRSWSVLLFLSIVGLLIHELYIFSFPAALLSVYIKRNKGFDIVSREVVSSIVICLIVLAVLMLTAFAGVNVPKEEFEATMAQKMGVAAYNHSLWSGYFEVFSSVDSNLNTGVNALLQIPEKIKYTIIPILYALLWALSNSYYSQVDLWKKTLILLALILPISAIFVASDFYRWVGMSANLSILYAISYSSIKEAFIPKKVFVVLFLFSFVAPFGSANLERPFPAHQLIIEKAFNH
ncbi:hypothetical protein [Pseudomonas fluorescens]|uniref:EpsG family protein n=1 Tax=Pseudomonas fluorescens TaxID=294 RepID=A0A5E7VVL4_PSEFL|nr:hypothetical protein [Pseudomonas fluorescens]VVQ26643.1 hypothetical protein PS928_06811 [Pseudomonas fluorescens]